MFPYFPRVLAAVFFAFILALIPATVVFGADISWAACGSVLYFAADNGPGANPAPILPSPGISLAWQFWGPLRLELTEDIYFTNYEYNTTLGYPMASDSANRSALVIGFITGVQVVGAFPLGEKGIVARVYGGPSIDLRIVTLAIGLNSGDTQGDIETNAQLQTEAIAKYFWSEGRWFLPVLGAGMDFPINEGFLLGFDFRVWFPLYRLATDKDIPAADGWRIGFGLRLTPK